MHDVGKIKTPLALLRKPAPLTDEELDIVRRHTVNGAHLLGEMKPLAMARTIARHHHENFDGSGYPDGLAGDDIPAEARIVKIADVYDALRSERPYKRAYPHAEAVEVIRHGDARVVPRHLDPRAFEAFLDHHAPIAEIWDASQMQEFVAAGCTVEADEDQPAPPETA
jgi:HD-GYP domain-containing protein (c-di-GMP phosphodiesterase class II)